MSHALFPPLHVSHALSLSLSGAAQAGGEAGGREVGLSVDTASRQSGGTRPRYTTLHE
jgi:hypothetical protein